MTTPTVTFADNFAGVVNRATASLTYTLRFSESVTGLDVTDFVVTNATISGVSGADDRLAGLEGDDVLSRGRGERGALRGRGRRRALGRRRPRSRLSASTRRSR